MYLFWIYICLGSFALNNIVADKGGIPHWLNSGHIPPGHKGSWWKWNQLLVPDVTPSPVVLPKGLPVEFEHKYRVWWTDLQSSITDCGHRNAPPLNPLFRVIGGHKSTVEATPWMVSLYSDLVKQHWCAGTLISPQWIVTAAHCFRWKFSIPELWTVYMGKTNVSQSAVYDNMQVRQINKIIQHPDYNDLANDYVFNNDIALLKLDRPVEFDSHVAPLCLIQSEEEFYHVIRTGSRCTITGYGISDQINRQRDVNILHEADIPLLNKADCMNVDAYGQQITNNMICAGLDSGGVDTCLGDSGGPIQCELEGKWFQIGVTSFGGENCAEPNKPGVYTDVSKYTDWIYKQLFLDYIDTKI